MCVCVWVGEERSRKGERLLLRSFFEKACSIRMTSMKPAQPVRERERAMDLDHTSCSQTADTVVTPVKRLSPSHSEITDPYEHSYFWKTLLRYWKLPAHIHHFPGANPMSIEESDFSRLQTDDFLAALKTDGVRHLLMMTTKPNSVDPIAIMIDRTKKMFEVEIWANEHFFCEGSLYDGEVVWEKDTLVYIVFDVILARGVCCSRLSYRERMSILHNTVLCTGDIHSDESIEAMIQEEDRFIARNNEYNFSIVPKKTVPKASLKSLWDERGQCYHRNDGIIFTLNSAAVDTGTSSSILKWKPSHSIDLRVQTETDGLTWRMYANKNNSGVLVDVTDIIDGLTPVLQNTKLLDAVKSRQPCIIECLITLDENRLVLTPERERTDKSSPNTVNTIEATIRNARQNISSDDLIELVHSN